MAEVLVLGAGFTHAFFPSAPLLTDQYPLDLSGLQSPFLDRVVGAERERSERQGGPGALNLERLLTRCDSPLPSDSQTDRAELVLLRHRVIGSFVERLARAGIATPSPLLERLARWILRENVTCLTFNYDEGLDEALFTQSAASARWRPASGYGFHCEASSTLFVPPKGPSIGGDRGLVLKLHGSLNWRVRLGAKSPFRLGDVFHHSRWTNEHEQIGLHVPRSDRFAAIESLLERSPFMVPPTLTKAELGNEPILGLLWRLAASALQGAERVTFIGYSLPVTDLAAQFLFGESIEAPGRVHVVSRQADNQSRANLRSTYEGLFGRMHSNQFEYDGAEVWADRIAGP